MDVYLPYCCHIIVEINVCLFRILQFYQPVFLYRNDRTPSHLEHGILLCTQCQYVLQYFKLFAGYLTSRDSQEGLEKGT